MSNDHHHIHQTWTMLLFVSYFGALLDEKTLLLRANAALSMQGKRLLGHF